MRTHFALAWWSSLPTGLRPFNLRATQGSFLLFNNLPYLTKAVTAKEQYAAAL